MEADSPSSIGSLSPIEDVQQSQATAAQIQAHVNQVAASLTGGAGGAGGVAGSGSSKRRQPHAGAGPNRDPKSRRRGESGRTGSGHGWEGSGDGRERAGGMGAPSRREKEELVDNGQVDYLRKRESGFLI